MSERKEYRVSDLIDQGVLLIGDGYRAKNIELSIEGIPFARVANVNGGFDFSDVDHFPVGELDKVGDKISCPGDTVFTSKGTVGRFAFVNESTGRFVYSPQLSYWRSLRSDVVDPRFLFYWMQGREFFGQADAVKGQTDMADYVNLADQRQMKITLPDAVEQRAIASVLSCLDDKIDLLHRQNKTFEALAETIFRQWFVEEAEEGWKTVRIADLTKTIQYGLTTSASTENIGPKFLRITDIQGGTINWDTVPYCKATSEEIEKYRLLDGDVVVARTGASTGENCLILDASESVFASYLVRFQFEDRSVGRYVAAFLRSERYSEYVAGCLGGSAQPNASAVILAAAELKLPPAKRLETYFAYISQFDAKTKRNHQQIRTLTQLRDTLLSKLMSGEVRVKQFTIS
jgi:type I restriction enzyme, S subunit